MDGSIGSESRIHNIELPNLRYLPELCIDQTNPGDTFIG